MKKGDAGVKHKESIHICKYLRVTSKSYIVTLTTPGLASSLVGVMMCFSSTMKCFSPRRPFNTSVSCLLRALLWNAHTKMESSRSKVRV